MRESGKKKQRKQTFDPCTSGWHYEVLWWAHEKSFSAQWTGQALDYSLL